MKQSHGNVCGLIIRNIEVDKNGQAYCEKKRHNQINAIFIHPPVMIQSNFLFV